MDELQGMIEHLIDRVSQLGGLLYHRTSTNVAGTFKEMTAQQWIRLVIIVGAYCLLRPYIVKMGAKHQVNEMEKQNAEEMKREAEISPNDLRGKVDIPEDTDDEDDAAGPDGAPRSSTASGAADWGKKARRRQRRVIKQMLDTEEQRLQALQDEEDDKDIADLLED